jgi:sulfatase maturation enzyme AslB (radical SAM superfamily)
MNQELFKKSIFLHIHGNEITHHLRNRKYHVSPQITSLLIAMDGAYIRSRDFASANKFGITADQFRFLSDEGLLVPALADESHAFYPHRVDIETVRHCNARCAYCPQSLYRKPMEIMKWNVFERVVAKIDAFNTTWIALNHYGEPLLDPFFKSRVNRINKHHRIFLATNGVLLTEDLIAFLADADLHSLSFNFPSSNPTQWSRLMGLPRDLFPVVKRTIESAVSKLSPNCEVNVIVQSKTSDRSVRIRKIRDHFESFGPIKVMEGFCRSRAGIVNNRHVISARHEGVRFFSGCDRIAAHLHVSWEGKSFLCCEDYYQDVILGDLLKDDLMPIMSSASTGQLRAEIYGLTPMRKNLICRNCAKIAPDRLREQNETVE